MAGIVLVVGISGPGLSATGRVTEAGLAAHGDSFRLDGDRMAAHPPGKAGEPFTAIFLADLEHVAVIEVSGNYDQWIGGELNVEPRLAVSEEYYRRHPDEVDFLFFFTTFELDTGGALAFHIGARNDVAGIGLELFDQSHLFGSGGVLRGTIDMAALSRYASRPLDQGFEDALVVMTHEVLHQWCCYTAAEGSALLGLQQAHWSYLLDSDASVMYGSDWRDNGDGTFSAVADRRFYSPLDLYLAGFYGEEEVAPFVLIDNPAVAAAQLPVAGAVVAGAPRTLTVADLVAADGPRLPAAADAPREFRAAFLLLKRPEDTVYDADVAAIDRLRREFATRFAILTGGRGVMRVLPRAAVDGETGEPAGTGGGEVRPPGGFDPAAALAWLRGRQTAEGFWQDHPGTRLRDTTEALTTLARLDGEFTRAGDAVAWLEQQQEASTDYLARAARDLERLGPGAAALRAEIVARQNPDGGWGAEAGHASDPLDTALALRAVAGASDAPPAAAEAAVQYLLATQGVDGGWSHVPGAPSRTAVTTTVLLALEEAGRAGTVTAPAVAWLAARQNGADGGFGDSPSTVHDTANVLEAAGLLRAGGIDIGAAETYLQDRQTLDGSWDGSVYSTARAAAALNGFRFPDWSFTEPPTAQPTSPREGELVEISATVSNDGDAASPATYLRIFDGDPATRMPVGEAVIPALGPGQSAGVDLTWETTGKRGHQVLTLVVDADGGVDELDEANNAATIEIEVRESPAGPDLEVRAGEVLLSPAAPSTLPAAIAISSVIRNFGLTDAEEVTVRLWQGAAGEGSLLEQALFPRLAAAASVVANFSYLLETPDAIAFTIEAAAASGEEDLANNTATVGLTPTPSVDLLIAADEIELEPELVALGAEIRFTVTVRNRGTSDSPPFAVDFEIRSGESTRVIATATLEAVAGTAVERSVVWTVDTVGELTFVAVADPRGVVLELDETNNSAARPFAATELTEPNLVVGFVEPPSSLLDGERRVLELAAGNIGGVAAPPTSVRLFDGDPVGGATIGPDVEVPGLPAGETAQVTFLWDTLGQAGSRTLTAVVDPDGAIPEVSEDDNASSHAIDVLPPPAGADLAIAPSDLELDPEVTDSLPTELAITARVRNLGQAEAPNVRVRLWAGPAGSGTQLQEISFGALAARSDLPAAFSHLLETSGVQTLTVEAVSDALEEDPGNNAAALTVSTVPAIDLAVTAADLTVSSDPVFVEAEAIFTVALRNRGTLPSGAFNVRYRVGDGNVVRDLGTSPLQLAAGESVLRELVWRVDLEGELTFTVELDGEDLVSETDEANNVGALPFTAMLAGDPNLTFAAGDLGFAPDPGLEGSPLQLTAVVRNNGGVTAENVRVGFYDGDPAAGASRVAEAVAPILPARSETTVEATWPEIAGAADRTIFAVADPDGDIAELDETDNRTFRLLEVESLPDLEVGEGSLALEPSFPVPGEAATLTVTVANLGQQQPEPFVVRVFLGDPAAGGQQVGGDQVLVLGAGGDTQAVFAFTLPADPPDTLVAVVDVGEAVRESDESNNAAALALAFQNRDFFVTQRHFSANGDGRKDTTRFFFRLDQSATAAARVVAVDSGDVVRQGPALSAVAGSWEWDGLDDLGRLVADGEYRIELIAGSGAVLGGALTELDTDRSPLILALGTPFVKFTNLTCDAGSIVGYAIADDDSTIFLSIAGDTTEFESGLYRIEADGNGLLQIADAVAPRRVAVSADGSRVAFSDYSVFGGVWVAAADGPPLTFLGNGRSIGFTPAGEVLIDDGSSVVAHAVEGGEARTVAALSDPDAVLSPDRRHLAMVVASDVWWVDVVRAETRILFSGAELAEMSWSPDSSKLAVSDAGGQVRVFDARGELIREFSVPQEIFPVDLVDDENPCDNTVYFGCIGLHDALTQGDSGHPEPPTFRYVGTPQWSESGSELAFLSQHHSDFDACVNQPWQFYGYEKVVMADLTSGEVESVAWGHPFNYICSGMTEVQVYPEPGVITDDEPELLPREQQTSFPAGGFPQSLPSVGELQWWRPDERLLLVGDRGIDLTQPNASVDLFEEFDRFAAREFTPSRQELLFLSTDRDGVATGCVPGVGGNLYALGSWLNLTADLRALPGAERGSVDLYGTAADLNLASYRLEWNNVEEAGPWELITPPSAVSVIDEPLGVWVPPGPGQYAVRLTVEDRAGNRKRVVRQVATGETPSLVSLYVTPSTFSATGSSATANEVEIHYDVLLPVHVDIQISRFGGERVRTIRRDHPQAVDGVVVIWDGSSDAGQPVPDGVYLVEIQGFRFEVTVDSTPPELRASITAVTRRGSALAPLICEWPVTQLRYLAELVGEGGMLEFRADRGIPGVSTSFEELPAECSPAAAPFDRCEVVEATSIAEAQILEYRASATDRAGNEALAAALPAEEVMVILVVENESVGLDGSTEVWFQRVPWFSHTEDIRPNSGLFPIDGQVADLTPQIVLTGDMGRMVVSESLREPIEEIFLEFRERDLFEAVEVPLPYYPFLATLSLPVITPFETLATPLMEFAPLGGEFGPVIPDQLLELRFGTAGLPIQRSLVLRLRAVDASGREHVSLPFVAHLRPAIFEGRLEAADLEPGEPYAAELHELLAVAGADPAADDVFWGLSFTRFVRQDFQTLVSSPDDPAFAVPRAPERFLKRLPDGRDVFLLLPGDLDPDASYSFSMQSQLCGTAEGGDPFPDGDPSFGNRHPGPGPICLENCFEYEDASDPLLLLTKVLVAEGSCEAPAAARSLRLTPDRSGYLGPLSRLFLTFRGEEDEVVFEVDQPDWGETYVYELPETLPLAAELRYQATIVTQRGKRANNAATFRPVPPPVVEISAPMPGEIICLDPGALDVQGTIRGEAKVDYLLELRRSGDLVASLVGERPFAFQSAEGRFVPGEITGSLGHYAEPVFEGPVRVHLEVGDEAGNYVCRDVPVVFDAFLLPTELSIDRDLFSPNGDGVVDRVAIAYFSTEEASVDLKVQTLTVDGEVEGLVVRNLVSGVVLQGEGTFLWDGRGDDGALVDDGRYRVVATFSDRCRSRSHEVFVEIDTTAPVVSISSPAAGVEVATAVLEVRGSATDRNFSSYSLEWRPDGSPIWTQLTARGTARNDAVLAVWNTRGHEGPAELRLSAMDRVGNRSETILPFTIETAGELIAYLEAVPDLFSPNGDGKLDSVALRWGLERGADVELAVLDRDDAIVRLMLPEASYDAGSRIDAWDGRADGADPLPEGAYTARLRATASGVAPVQQEERVTVVVDTTPPAILVTRPVEGAWVQGTGAILGSITDPHFGSYSLELSASPSGPAWTLADSGAVERRDHAFTSLLGLADGAWALRFRAADRAENEAERRITFRIDRTPPVVALTHPASGSLLGAAGGPVEVRGTVEEANFAAYRLEVRVQSSTSWTLLASSTALPAGELLAAWDLAQLADGDYVLRLTAEDLAGWVSEASVTVTVDNTPPIVAIDAPVDGSFVTGPLPVFGTAADLHFLEYRLAVAPRGTERFSELSSSTLAVPSGVLLDWQVLPPEGPWTLRLDAADSAGNEAAAAIVVTVDRTPPPAPLELAVELVDADDARLDWNAVAAADLAGYAVFRDGVRIKPELIEVTEYLDPDLASGRYVYTVAAVDRAQLESDHSNEAAVVVDVDPPVARLRDPADGSAVRGVVDVVGTAYSRDDFREYRLYVGAGDGSAGWELLRRSAVPTQAGTLGEWSTLGLPEDAPFTLRLEAEDLSGNVAEDRSLVTIDNQPPEAPQNLVAEAVATDVDTSWDANTEPDLSGYLLYRDGRLANATSAVVGDLAPFLIPPNGVPGSRENYLDPALPDGTYTYRVVAMDKAGNLSPPSDPDDATLESGPPRAVIAVPEDGTRFDQPLYVLATSEDRDVAEVRLQFRPGAGGEWADLTPPDADQPFEATWDNVGLALGPYDLRAVATDFGGRTDPTPPTIRVTHADVTPPPAVIDLAVESIDGCVVVLTWTEVLDGGQGAHYRVYRAGGGDEPVLLSTSPLAAPGFTDPEAPEGTQVYVVTALDADGNESLTSNEAPALIYAPALEPPESPTILNFAAVAGSGPIPGAATVAGLANAAGTAALPGTTAGEEGAFVLPGIELALGVNTITVRLVDAGGNVSKPASVEIHVVAPPSPPVWEGAVVTGDVAELTWRPNPESNILGYRAFRDGKALVSEQEVDDFTGASASDETFGLAASAIDGDPATGWFAFTFDPFGSVAGEWLAASWDAPRRVTRVDLDRGSQMADFDVEAWLDGAWETLVEVRGNVDLSTETPISPGVSTTGIRIVLRSETTFADIREMRVRYESAIPATSLVETGLDGTFTYTLKAVNEFLLESDFSEPLVVTVGNGDPEPVVLSGTAAGSDVHLEWNASNSPDVVRYDLLRDADLILEHFDLSDLTALDPDLPNATYLYQVVAIDDFGNESDVSNTVAVTVAVEPPPAPIHLTVTPSGDPLGLLATWEPGPGSEPAAYVLRRSVVAGGPYQVWASTAETSYLDVDNVIGQTVYYVVVGVDALGNESSLSNEASGVLEAPPLPPPILTEPRTATGEPFEVFASETPLAGESELGTEVAVNRDGVEVGRASPRRQLVIRDSSPPVSGYSPWPVRLAPDGRRALLRGVGQALLLWDFDTATGTDLPAFSGEPGWRADGEEILFVNNGYINVYRVSDGSLESGGFLQSAYLAVPSPDGGRTAAAGYLDNVPGLWILDRAAGTWTPALEGSFPALVQWSPDGSRLVYRLYSSQRIEVVELATGSSVVVSAGNRPENPSWSPDGSEIIYVADGESGRQIFLYSLVSGTSEQLTSTPQSYFRPQFVPDGSAIAFIAGPGRIYTLDLEDRQQALLFESPRAWDFAWAGNDRILVDFRTSAARFALRSRFELSSVALDLGENELVAVAEDGLGRRSDPSEPLVVLRRSSRPDLVVFAENVILLPQLPRTGEVMRIAVEVHNAGEAASPPAEISVLVGGGGELVTVAEGELLAAIPSGASQTLLLDFTPRRAGVYSVEIVVDPADEIAEAREENNQAMTSFSAVAEAAPVLAVDTDRVLYFNHETVTVELTLENAGATFDGAIDLQIEDDSGFLVTGLSVIPVADLTFGATFEATSRWDTGVTLAGGYRIRARLSDAQATPIADELAAFVIGENAELAADVATDRATYVTGETVRLNGVVLYAQGNEPLAGVEAVLRVADPLGSTVQEWTQPLGTLLAGSSSQVQRDWPSTGGDAGVYRVDLEMRRAGTLSAAAETSFELVEQAVFAELAAAKTAALALDRDGDGAASPGDRLRYEIALTNSGNGEAAGVVLTDPLPQHAFLVLGSIATTLGTVEAADPVTVAIETLAAGVSAVVSFQVDLEEAFPAGVREVSNQGTVDADGFVGLLTDDPATPQPGDPTVTPVVAAPRLVASKSDALALDRDGDGAASPGDLLRYEITLVNNGNLTATSVRFEDLAPEHSTLVAGSAAAALGAVESGNGEGDAGVEVRLDELAPGEVETIVFAVEIDNPLPGGVRQVSNQGLVASAELPVVLTDDPEVGGAADPTVTAVLAEPLLVAEKTVRIAGSSDRTATPGDVLEYRLVLRNLGNIAATDAVLTDPLPAHTSLVAGSLAASAGVVVAHDPVTVAFAQLSTDSEATVVFRVTVDDPLPTGVRAISNQGLLTSAELVDLATDDPATPEAGDPTVIAVRSALEISIADLVVHEGAGVAELAVTLDAAAGGDVTVDFATGEATALSGVDFQPLAGRVTVPVGETAATVAIPLIDDPIHELDEAFTVTLFDPVGGDLVDGVAAVTILDDDPVPAVSIGDAAIEEGAGAVAGLALPVTLSNPTVFPVSVSYSTADGTALAGSDYAASAGTWTLPAEALGGTLAIVVLEDAVDELDETFTVALFEPQQAVLGDSEAIGTILDDDDALASIGDAVVEEGDEDATDAIFSVSLSTPSDRPITVDYATADGSAVAGRDYLTTSGQVELEPLQTAASLSVAVLGDVILEPGEETFTVWLSNPANTALADAEGLGTILDDEVCEGPNLLRNPGAEVRPEGGDLGGEAPPGWTEVEGGEWRRRFAEPDPAEGAAYFSAGSVELAELAQDVDVTAYGTRIAAGAQLFAFDGMVRTREESPQDVARIVVEYRDAANEVALETFDSGEVASPLEWLEVSDARTAPAGTGWIRVRLLANRFTEGANDGYFDALRLRSLRAATLAIDDVAVHEGGPAGAGDAHALFTLLLSCPYERELSVTYATADGTATEIEDYLPASGIATLSAGETAAEIPVPVVDDEIHERHETFTMTLADPLADGASGLGQAVLLDAVGIGTILDDDFCPRSPGFWKNHVDEWPADYLVLGGAEVSAEGMLALLSYGGPDAASKLSRQLVAAHLNMRVGSPLFILPVVEDADAFLEAFPAGSDPRGEDRRLANDLKDDLDAYNSLDCEEVPLDPGSGGDSDGGGSDDSDSEDDGGDSDGGGSDDSDSADDGGDSEDGSGSDDGDSEADGGDSDDGGSSDSDVEDGGDDEGQSYGGGGEEGQITPEKQAEGATRSTAGLSAAGADGVAGSVSVNVGRSPHFGGSGLAGPAPILGV